MKIARKNLILSTRTIRKDKGSGVLFLELRLATRGSPLIYVKSLSSIILVRAWYLGDEAVPRQDTSSKVYCPNPWTSTSVISLTSPWHPSSCKPRSTRFHFCRICDFDYRARLKDKWRGFLTNRKKSVHYWEIWLECKSSFMSKYAWKVYA